VAEVATKEKAAINGMKNVDGEAAAAEEAKPKDGDAPKEGEAPKTAEEKPKA